MSVRGSTKINAIRAGEYLTAYLKNDGNNNLCVDGSMTPVVFSTSPPPDRHLEVGRFLLYLRGNSGFDDTKFMNLDALANGVQIKINGQLITTWRDNIDIIIDMFDLTPAGIAFGKDARTLAGRWSLTKVLGGEGVLCPDGQSVQAVIQDDLRGGIFRIKIQGELRDA
jgi:hypothetical protein